MERDEASVHSWPPEAEIPNLPKLPEVMLSEEFGRPSLKPTDRTCDATWVAESHGVFLNSRERPYTKIPRLVEF